MSTNWLRFGQFALCLVGTDHQIEQGRLPPIRLESSCHLEPTPHSCLLVHVQVGHNHHRPCRNHNHNHHHHHHHKLKSEYSDHKVHRDIFRELLWHSFTELLIFLLPIISAAKLKSRIRWSQHVKIKTNKNWTSHLAGLWIFSPMADC